MGARIGVERILHKTRFESTFFYIANTYLTSYFRVVSGGRTAWFWKTLEAQRILTPGMTLRHTSRQAACGEEREDCAAVSLHAVDDSGCMPGLQQHGMQMLGSPTGAG